MAKFYRKAGRPVIRHTPQPREARVKSLLLLLERRLGHQHVRLHPLPAASLTYAPHRRRIEVIAAHREPAIGADRRALMRHVQTAPPVIGPEPDIAPGMAGGIAALA